MFFYCLSMGRVRRKLKRTVELAPCVVRILAHLLFAPREYFHLQKRAVYGWMHGIVNIKPGRLENGPGNQLAIFFPQTDFTSLLLPGRCKPIRHIYCVNVRVITSLIHKVLKALIIWICCCAEADVFQRSLLLKLIDRR